MMCFPFVESPLLVEINMQVRSMGPISEADMVRIFTFIFQESKQTYISLFKKALLNHRAERHRYFFPYFFSCFKRWRCCCYFDEVLSHFLKSYSMDCYFRQSWVDRRLAFSGQKNLALSIEMLRKIWKPDTYIYNGRKSYLHTITTPNKFVRLFPEGKVLYSQR